MKYRLRIIKVGERKGTAFVEVNLLDKKETIEVPITPEEKDDFATGEIRFYNKRVSNGSRIEIEPRPIPLRIIQKTTVFDEKKELTKEAVVVEFEGSRYTVSKYDWQCSKLWKNEFLLCSVIKTSGNPIIHNRDYRHPVYEIGKTYEFNILEFARQSTKSSDTWIVKLKGEDDLIYTTKMYPNQQNFLAIGSTLSCKVADILNYVKISQSGNTDSYFKTFDEIFRSASLKQKYFDLLWDKKRIRNQGESQLVEQYESHSAFWVITYLNKVLPGLFNDGIQRYDYKMALDTCNLQIEGQSWVINKGLVGSIGDVRVRSKTKDKSLGTLAELERDREIITMLQRNADVNSNLREIAKRDNRMTWITSLIRFTNPILIDDDTLNDVISSLSIPTEAEWYTAVRFKRILRQRKNEFMKQIGTENFHLITKKLSSSEKKKLDKYLNWAYFEYKVERLFNNNFECNLLLSEIIRGLSQGLSNVLDRTQLIRVSYYLLENIHANHRVELLRFVDGIGVKPINDLDEIIRQIDNDEAKLAASWHKLLDAYNQNEPIQVRLLKSSKSGYELDFNGVKGFLPRHNIQDTDFKPNTVADCEIITNVRPKAYDSTLRYFIVEHIPRTETKNHYISNLTANRAVVGDVVSASVKNVVSYRVFLTSPVGEGLLHVKEIFDFSWEKSELPEIFRVGIEIKVVILSIDKEGKINFSLKRLKKIDSAQYSQIVSELIDPETDSNRPNVQSNLEKGILRLKGYCFEELALTQPNLEHKINCFRIAKQLYANVNSSRSYLINIFTDYFETLISLKECIEQRDLEKLVEVKIQAEKIVERIEDETISAYPDTRKLKDFVQLLLLFNETSDESTDKLIELVRRYSSERSKVLTTVSKIILSNNLLSSEVKNESEEFVLKNLKMIQEFLAEGILSLKETAEDLYRREQLIKIQYYKSVIENDENQMVEFKSTLFVPVLAEKQVELLKELKAKPSTEDIKQKINAIEGKQAEKGIIHSTIKNICAFANTEGGTLFIGVSDDKRILGVDHEFNRLPTKSKQSKDGYGLYFDALVKDYLSDSVSSLLSTEWVQFQEGLVLVVNVKKSANEVFVRKDECGDKADEFYVRKLSSAVSLSASEIVNHVKQKSGDSTKLLSEPKSTSASLMYEDQ
jgi:predicted RNA-binding protein with RPS1 domain